MQLFKRLTERWLAKIFPKAAERKEIRGKLLALRAASVSLTEREQRNVAACKTHHSLESAVECICRIPRDERRHLHCGASELYLPAGGGVTYFKVFRIGECKWESYDIYSEP